MEVAWKFLTVYFLALAKYSDTIPKMFPFRDLTILEEVKDLRQSSLPAVAKITVNLNLELRVHRFRLLTQWRDQTADSGIRGSVEK